jgi:hypothetical protein
VLIPLSSGDVGKLEAGRKLHVRAAGMDETYEVGDLKVLVAALEEKE